jgi:hypothetical protein
MAPLAGLWMSKAYRIPRGKFATVDRITTKETAENTPITEIVVNSLITNVGEGQRVKGGAPLVVKGIAWDAGYGIRSVDVSADGGQSWQSAELGADPGRFSFRPWQYVFKPSPGKHDVSARATNGLGASQSDQLIFNPAGCNNNVLQRIGVEAAGGGHHESNTGTPRARGVARLHRCASAVRSGSLRRHTFDRIANVLPRVAGGVLGVGPGQ